MMRLSVALLFACGPFAAACGTAVAQQNAAANWPSKPIHAVVPLAELFGYATAIRSLSKGRSSYSMEPSHFEPVPANLVAAILDQKEAK